MPLAVVAALFTDFTGCRPQCNPQYRHSHITSDYTTYTHEHVCYAAHVHMFAHPPTRSSCLHSLPYTGMRLNAFAVNGARSLGHNAAWEHIACRRHYDKYIPRIPICLCKKHAKNCLCSEWSSKEHMTSTRINRRRSPRLRVRYIINSRNLI